MFKGSVWKQGKNRNMEQDIPDFQVDFCKFWMKERGNNIIIEK